MKGLEDPQFRAYYEELLKLDWTGLDLWAVGGIVSGWETEDIDCVVYGDRPEAEINALFLQCDQVWSLFWTDDPKAITMDPRSKQQVYIKCYSRNRHGDRLAKRHFKFPSTKNLLRMKQGLYHGAPIQLIQNGTQIYL